MGVGGRGNDEVVDPIQRADWRQVRALYEQFSSSVSGASRAEGPPLSVIGGLAEAMARVFASYEHEEQAFLDDLVSVMAKIDGLTLPRVECYRRLYKDVRLDAMSAYRSGPGRRRPRPLEAAAETVWRIQDLNRVRDALEGIPTSAILGGSLSYGRFFNTCGAAGKPSDIDLVLVVPTYDDLPTVADRLRTLDFLDGGQIDRFEFRVSRFSEAQKLAPGRCAFQHKLGVWDSDPLHRSTREYQIPFYYSLALHVLSEEDLRYIALSDVPGFADLDRSISVFREDVPGPSSKLRCFAGLELELDIEVQDVEGGFLANEVVALVVDDRLFAGLHLNLLLPQFEVRWETAPLRLRLELLNLRWKLLARLSDERRIRAFEVQRLSLCHVREEVFAPHVTRRVDRD